MSDELFTAIMLIVQGLVGLFAALGWINAKAARAQAGAANERAAIASQESSLANTKLEVALKRLPKTRAKRAKSEGNEQ